MTLSEAIADCLQIHAEALEKLGSDRPELDRRIDPVLREKVDRQRRKVEMSLSGDPVLHQAHVEALTKGLRICLRRLGKPEPERSKPPLPVWDDTAKRWVRS